MDYWSLTGAKLELFYDFWMKKSLIEKKKFWELEKEKKKADFARGNLLKREELDQNKGDIKGN